MRRMINKLTGGGMWVHESRVDEYLAAGHVLAADSKPAKPVKQAEAPVMPEPEAKEEPKTSKVIPVKKFTAAKRKKG